MNEEKKTNLTCGIGCGTAVVLFLIGLIVLLFIVYGPPIQPIESKAIGYMIEHVDEFKDEFSAMGYDVRIDYTWGDIWNESMEEDEYINKQTKFGHNGRGRLVLTNEKEKFVFDVGFDKCDINRDDGTEVILGKNSEDKVLDLREKNGYPVYVIISGDAVKEGYRGSLNNSYNIDFTEPAKVGLHGNERKRDKWIKEYISAEELREIYERCIGLQEKLVELYEARM